jgi:uncharacterized coiled-coil protein SlyX
MSKEESLEKRISELEEKINYVILQINNLQHKVSDSNPELEQMMNLLQILTSSLQISKAPFTILSQSLSWKDRILKKHPDIKYDDISKSIIDVLERKGRMNISQLTEGVRKERGSASRRIVRERVDKLIQDEIIIEVDEGYGRQLELVQPEEEE